MDIWQILENVIASGNIVTIAVVCAFIVGYTYFTNRANNNTAMLELIEKLSVKLDANFLADEENRAADLALAAKVEHLESQLNEISLMFGKGNTNDSDIGKTD